MKKFKSTCNGGTTIILDGLKEAIEGGLKAAKDRVEGYEKLDPKGSTELIYFNRDDNALTKATKPNLECLTDAKNNLWWFEECARDIEKGNASQKEFITKLAEELSENVMKIAPSLMVGYSGFERAEDGIDADAGLIASGEERCAFRRKRGDQVAKSGAGDGAFRVIINTDCSWWGKPNDNAALMAALVMILQQSGPVELWIQQGWLGKYSCDGVTLFKLDFTGAFDPTQLAFWIGHPMKDGVFSFYVSRWLVRDGTGTSTKAEIPCDLYLRGDWSRKFGVYEAALKKLPPFELHDLMAKWIADTAYSIMFEADEDQSIQA